MTTAHRPTFDPARGKDAQRGPAYHQRLQPAHTLLKVRQPGQGGAADSNQRDLRAELLAAEAAHFAKKEGKSLPTAQSTLAAAPKRTIEQATEDPETEESSDTEAAKRRKILEETRDIDKDDSDSSDSDSSDDEDEEDETAELMRELEKIKRERAEAKAREEAEKAAKEQDAREEEIAYGNPLLNPQKQDFGIKRRWDDDVVFKNQARGTEQKTKKEFVNDLLRSDFHKKFMGKYVR